MTLHPLISAELLDMEIAAARTRLSNRFSTLERVESNVICTLESTAVGTARIRFDGLNYDAEPFKVGVITEDGSIAPPDRWPPGSCGGLHPLLGYPFICMRGTFEYHAHPSHLADRWDIHRADLRLPQLLAHFLKRCGR